MDCFSDVFRCGPFRFQKPALKFCRSGLWILLGLFSISILAAPMKAQNLFISEFLAANSANELDEDGEASDWVEIYNPENQPLSLLGWHLSDDPNRLTQWTFPDVTIPGQGFLLVFASGKDRSNPGSELHTNFSLDREGEYLALVRPDGVTVASEFGPNYPLQLSDVSYGIRMETETVLLVPSGRKGRYFVPTENQPGNEWASPVFDDATWPIGIMGMGYDREQTPTDPDAEVEDVTQPGDDIEPTSFNSPVNEEVDKAIDNNPATKYLNFDKLNAGFTVTPSSGPSVVTRLRFTSANDAPDRDPTSFVLSGSNDGVQFVEIARGEIPEFPERFYSVETSFENADAYAQYRLIFPTVRNANNAVAVQIAEVEFLGYTGPAPISFGEAIATNLDEAMFGRTPSMYLRVPFSVQEGQPLDSLALRVRYDDGFAAYINGEEVARANAPADLAYDSLATANRSRDQAVRMERFDLSGSSDLIQPGSNLLAIHAWNDALESPEFLIQPQLDNTWVNTGSPGYFEKPTPGQANGDIRPGLVSMPVLNQTRGFYSEPFEVTVSSATQGAEIRYTLNGSQPAPDGGQLYTGPIPIIGTTVLRVAAFRENWLPSPIATHTYLFLTDVLKQSRESTLAAGFPSHWNGQEGDYEMDSRITAVNGPDAFGGKYSRQMEDSLLSLPSFSIVMDPDAMFGSEGIYSNPENRGAGWEREASFEWFDPEGKEEFQEDGGIRIQGGAFRRFDLTLKKSFRPVFRSEYGATKLEYPLFGENAAAEFDNFILRANSNDAWPWGGSSALYVRDAFAHETLRAMGHAAPHTRFVHLYINGLYWGLYNPVERPDATFSASYHGGVKDTWDAINQDSVPDGTRDAWNRLLTLLQGDTTSNELYQRIQGNNPDGSRNPDYDDLLDVENMIDYMILNFYMGNADWPHRNFWVGRNRDNGDGFHFYTWDSETAMGLNSGVNTDRTSVNNSVAQPYAALRANEEFRMLFADHVHRHFFNGGVFYVNPNRPGWDPANPQNNQPAARLVALTDQIDRAIVAESARWGDQLNASPYTRDEHWRTERDALLANYLPQRSRIVLDQFRNAGLYPQLDAPQFNQHGGKVEPGFQVAMNAPVGTIYFTIDGSDPREPIEIEERSRITAIASTHTKQVLIPSTANGGSTLGSAWQAPAYDDSSWSSGTGGVGYDAGTGYQNLIGIDVNSSMRQQNGSAFIRIPFHLEPETVEAPNFMTLKMRFDDGFAAYLNGEKIAVANAPDNLQWNSFATGLNDDSSAQVFREFDVSPFVETLQPGANLLAIHGLNVSLSSSDFLIDAELIVGERRILGGEPSALVYSEPVTLADLTTIKARTFNGFEWSALNEATFVVGTPRLVISELDYHPSPLTQEEIAAGYSNENDFEFIELFNAGTGTLDLNGVRFIDGIEFDFTGSRTTQLRPGEYLLVVKQTKAFEARHGSGLPVAGEYSGRLSNGGERIELVDGNQQSLLAFTYGTRLPWPQSADGQGPSLELIDPDAELNLPENWQASMQTGGTPGTASNRPSITIHEVLRANDHLIFRFWQEAGLQYSVYVKADLGDTGWQSYETLEALPDRAEAEVTVPLSDSEPARFFKVEAAPKAP